MVSHEHITSEIPEDPDNPFRLGRKINHDPRSEAFPFRSRKAEVIKSRGAWSSPLPILDQGNLGSCVPNTGVEWLATANYLRPAIATAKTSSGVSDYYLTDPVQAESYAIELYRRVTRLDPFTGEWEPDDTGSDGTSLANLFIDLAWIESFTHAFDGLSDVLNALGEGPVMMGSNWYSSMFNPDSSGECVITPNATIAGGHQYLLTGKIDAERQRVEMRNHWSSLWGLGGCAWLSYNTVARLLGEDGDAQILKAKVGAMPPFPQSPPKGCLAKFLPASIGRRLGRI